MAVKFSLGTQSVIMSDGDWNGSPDNYFATTEEIEDVTTDLLDFIEFDLSGYDLSSASGGSLDLELEVLGDHNAPNGESLTIETTYGDFTDTSTLLVNGYTGFWQGETGPTVTGAQPNQGDLYIELDDGTIVRSALPAGVSGVPGVDNFTADVVTAIIEETATLYSGTGDSNIITASLDLDPDADTLRFDLEIPSENSIEDGVDISQTTATVELSVDFDSEHDISNMVFYFGSGDAGDGCLKLKIDGFDEFWDNLNESFDSTSTMDMMIDDATLKALFNDTFGEALDAEYDLDGDGEWENDWSFGGFSTKAGRDFDTDYADRPSEARGEGEYIGDGSLAEDCYGAAGEVAFEIDAASYDEFAGMWESNIDSLFA